MARSNGYTVGVAVDADAARKGLETGLIEPLDDAQNALVDLAKSKGPKELEKQLEAAGDATEKLKKETKETADVIQDEFRRSYARMKQAERDAVNSAEDGLNELKDESRSTAKEAAASFDGSAESIVDMFQEVAANAFAGFGPAGLVAGVAVAAGIGAATEAFGQNQEKAEQAKQKVREYGLAIIESGNSGAALTYVTDNLKAIVTNSDDAAKKLSDIQKITAKFPDLAGDTAALAKAYSGNAEALDAMIEKTRKLAAAEVSGNATSAGVANAQKKKQAELENVANELERVQKETATAQQIEEDWLASGGQEFLNKAALIDQVNSAYDDAAGAVDNYVNQETGIFDTQAYVDAMNAKLQALGEYQTLLAQSSLSTNAKKYLATLGAEASAQLMQAYKNGTDAQKASLDKIWSEAGRSNSGQYLSGVKNAIPDRIDKAPKITVDTTAAAAEMSRFLREQQNKTVTITVSGKDRAGRWIF